MNNVIKIESMEELEKILDKLAEKIPDHTQINVFILGDVIAGNECTGINTGTQHGY